MIHTMLLGVVGLAAVAAALFGGLCLVAMVHDDAPKWMRLVGAAEALLLAAWGIGVIIQS